MRKIENDVFCCKKLRKFENDMFWLSFGVKNREIFVYTRGKELRQGTIQILRNHWTGWVGSENGHFCLLPVHREWVGQKKSKNLLT